MCLAEIVQITEAIWAARRFPYFACCRDNCMFDRGLDLFPYLVLAVKVKRHSAV